MAKVTLDFTPPSDPDIVALRIYEGPTIDGPFAQIERLAVVGAYPNYITRYTTSLAADATDWFSIAWENADGAVAPLSEAIQGGTTTVVQKIVDRVMLRDASLNEIVVTQEAAAAIQSFYGEGVNPFDPTLDPSYMKLSGLTLLTLARVQVHALGTAGSSTSGWTAGLVSMKSGTTHNLKDLQDLLREAAKLLGIPQSRVAQMAEIEIAGGLSQIVSADISRLQIEVE